MDTKGVGSLTVTENDLQGDPLDLFETPVPNNEYVDGDVQEYLTNMTNQEGPFEFEIRTDGRRYLDLPQARLFGELKITKKDDTPLGEDDNVALTNLAACGIFKQIEVSINEVGVSDSTSASFAYKSVIETILNFGTDAKNSHLRTSLYFKDEAGKHESTALTGNTTNSGYLARKKMSAKSKKIQFCTPIFNDFIQTKTMIPQACRLKIKFIRQSDAFVLMADEDNYKIHLSNFRLYMRHVKINEEDITNHRKYFSSDYMATFPVTRTQIKTFVLGKGRNSETLPQIFKGHLPRSIIFCMVSQKAYNGDIKKNPYNFQHFNMEEFAIRVNGVRIPGYTLKYDFKNGLVMKGYRNLYDNIGYKTDNSGSITYEEYINGFTFNAFDLSPDGCNGFHLHKSVLGVIDVEINFSEVLEDHVTLLAYANYDNNVFMDKHTNVTTDYGRE